MSAKTITKIADNEILLKIVGEYENEFSSINITSDKIIFIVSNENHSSKLEIAEDLEIVRFGGGDPGG